jgi:hypothetical protein
MIPIEVFAAKDEGGHLRGVMLSVPVDCGLRRADTLRVHGSHLIPMAGRSVLAIDLPSLDEETLQVVRQAASEGGKIAVGEFTALGLADSYLLALDVVGEPSAAASAGEL